MKDCGFVRSLPFMTRFIRKSVGLLIPNAGILDVVINPPAVSNCNESMNRDIMSM